MRSNDTKLEVIFRLTLKFVTFQIVCSFTRNMQTKYDYNLQETHTRSNYRTKRSKGKSNQDTQDSSGNLKNVI